MMKSGGQDAQTDVEQRRDDAVGDSTPHLQQKDN
jgi:hypothetical protein